MSLTKLELFARKQERLQGLPKDGWKEDGAAAFTSGAWTVKTDPTKDGRWQVLHGSTPGGRALVAYLEFEQRCKFWIFCAEQPPPVEPAPTTQDPPPPPPTAEERRETALNAAELRKLREELELRQPNTGADMTGAKGLSLSPH